MKPAPGMTITIGADGPYYVSGSVPLYRGEIIVNEAGEATGWREIERIPTDESYMLCRCGESSSKPFCDEIGRAHV